jgi:hypothetical protein
MSTSDEVPLGCMGSRQALAGAPQSGDLKRKTGKQKGLSGWKQPKGCSRELTSSWRPCSRRHPHLHRGRCRRSPTLGMCASLHRRARTGAQHCHGGGAAAELNQSEACLASTPIQLRLCGCFVPRMDRNVG